MHRRPVLRMPHTELMNRYFNGGRPFPLPAAARGVPCRLYTQYTTRRAPAQRRCAQPVITAQGAKLKCVAHSLFITQL